MGLIILILIPFVIGIVTGIVEHSKILPQTLLHSSSISYSLDVVSMREWPKVSGVQLASFSFLRFLFMLGIKSQT